MEYTIEHIRRIVDGAYLLRSDVALPVEHLLTDSRRLLFPASTVFFAISGPRRSGRQFIEDLYKKGVRNFIVSASSAEIFPGMDNANVIEVNDVLHSLQQLAAYHRSFFTIPVVGITGSNGKTIVKEWLYQLLQSDYNIVRSPRSYNSQIGVPLSVWQIQLSNTLALFEAGISYPGEMGKIAEIINPGTGILTSIGEAHNEGFDDIQQKIVEKCRLFAGCSAVFFPKDDLKGYIDLETLRGNILRADVKLISWSRNSEAVLSISGIDKRGSSTLIKARYQEEKDLQIEIPFTDEASVCNAITCWNYLLYLGIKNDIIARRMLLLRSVEMRLELKEGINNCSVINDSYSTDINSLAIALDFLQQQQQHTGKTVILSDILQTGKSPATLYREIAGILIQKNVTRLIGVGKDIQSNRDRFSGIPETTFFSSTGDFLANFHQLHFNNETILLKGARIFEFEQISRHLVQKTHQTVLEIDLNAVAHNLKVYQQFLQPGTKLMAMVKAFGYGSGSFEIANLLQFHKVDYLTVAYADEGVELRKAGIALPIMVMNAEEITFDLLVEYNLEPEIFSEEIYNAFEKYLVLSGIQYFPIHIKLDTGMHRLGFEPDGIGQLAEKLANTYHFKVQSVFSHLVGSDNSIFDDFTEKQAKIFSEGCNIIRNKIGYDFIRHIANTSAIHRHRHLQMDMVRLGIGLYGVDSEEAIQEKLKNVTTLKTTVSQIKRIKEGETVGYSRSGVLRRDSIIATVRIGYADGYPRVLGNGAGKMYISGKRVPVVGNVCMDMTMLDVTEVPGIKEGDEVTVFGRFLPVTEVARDAGTIAYEMLTSVSRRVKRVYFEE